MKQIKMSAVKELVIDFNLQVINEIQEVFS
jgi:hypothetical protein